jgi:hypothetical protein
VHAHVPREPSLRERIGALTSAPTIKGVICLIVWWLMKMNTQTLAVLFVTTLIIEVAQNFWDMRSERRWAPWEVVLKAAGVLAGIIVGCGITALVGTVYLNLLVAKYWPLDVWVVWVVLSMVVSLWVSAKTTSIPSRKPLSF